MKTRIHSGTVVTATQSQAADVIIAGEKIEAVGGDYSGRCDREIDAAGKLILPGTIDAHTHMGIPILHTRSSDDFASGTAAAACGGVTTVMDFTVQEKGQALTEALEVRMALAREQSHVDYTFHCNVTDVTSETPSEMGGVNDMGVCSFKVFTAYGRAGMMLQHHELEQVFARAAELEAIAMVHAEDGDAIDRICDDLIARRQDSARFHPLSRPVETEVAAVRRVIQLARETGVTLYIVHLTSGAALELIQKAQAEGLPISAETCPQYLIFTQEAYHGPEGHYYIASPPFRETGDCEALWRGIQSGAISTVGTDHCPFTKEQMDSGGGRFHLTPNGLPGVETLLPLVHHEGVGGGRISINRMVEVLSEAPARIFGLYPRKGVIQKGSDADLVIFDRRKDVILGAKMLHSNTDWSPYEGKSVLGYPERVFLRGREIAREGQLVSREAGGQFLAV